jgi:Kelch motif
MLVIGGRTDTVGDTVSLEVYDTETSEWNRFPTV